MKQKLRNLRSQINIGNIIRNYLLLTIGGILLAINANLFLIPFNFTPGGVFSIAILINYVTDWPIGITMFIINIPLMGIGFKWLGRFGFLVRTLYVTLLFTFGVDILPYWLPPTGIADDRLLNALYGAILGGIALGLLTRGRGSAAGTSILGRVLQLKTGIPISQVYLMTDGIIILVVGLILGWEQALYGLLILFIRGIVVDYVLEGPSVIRMVFIITNKPEEIAQAVLRHLGVGITAWNGKGMFTETERTILFCTISRPDINILKITVSEIDADAFVVVGQGHKASGGRFRLGT